jgi:hypothetical protein
VTYVFDGLISSIFLWKECCVGVATDTETVDELCISVSRVRGGNTHVVAIAYHDEARRSRPHPTSISEDFALLDRGRGCVEQRKVCSLEEEEVWKVEGPWKERLSYLASCAWRCAMPQVSESRSSLCKAAAIPGTLHRTLHIPIFRYFESL